MSREHRRYTSSVDPYGYEFLHVDEDCLSGEDRRQAIVSAVDQPREGISYLTRDERETLAGDLEEIRKAISPLVFYQGEHLALTYRRAEFARLGVFRAHARQKYNSGHAVWYGDRPPWQAAAPSTDALLG